MTTAARTLLRRFSRNRDGAAAVEFALVALPLFMLLIGIIEIALMFFVDAGLDAAVRKSSRTIRTGEAVRTGATLAAFKARICNEMTLLFDCESSFLVRVVVVSDLSSIVDKLAVGTDHTLAVSETFDPGKSSDYVLVQAFLPWKVAGFLVNSSDTLEDGRAVLASATLFRNEPF